MGTTKTSNPRGSAASVLRKLLPTAKLPAETILGRLSEADRELLTKRLSEPLECVYDPRFRRKTMPELTPEATAKTQQTAQLTLLPSRGAATPTDVLSADEEQTLFLRFNYCRHRLMQVLRKYRHRRLDAQGTQELLDWEHAANEERAAIVRANTSLVLAMARRSRNAGVELSELVSEGNLALLRCVDKFDTARGFKFSTYACRAILASFSRAAAKAARFRAHFPATYDPAVERSDYLDRKRERIEFECVEELREILFDNSADLSSVERRVLDARFSLSAENEVATTARRRTLDQVGLLLGVSKERVRQIQNQAMSKLRAALEQRLPAAS